MNAPLVSVVCVCYNHERFVREAIESVRIQNYSNIQLIVVDDHSTDNSVDIIQKALLDFPSAQFIAQESNQGNCRAFNRGFEKALGEFIIDLSADDVLYPERITKGVLLFQTLGEETLRLRPMHQIIPVLTLH